MKEQPITATEIVLRREAMHNAVKRGGIRPPEFPSQIREIKLGEAVWPDENGMWHWVIGERAVTQDPSTLLTYTKCGCADVEWDLIHWGKIDAEEYEFCVACMAWPSFAKQPRPKMLQIHTPYNDPDNHGLPLEVTAAQEPESRLVFRIGPYKATLDHGADRLFLCGWLRAHTAPEEGV